MELIVINENKLKIMMSELDMKNYGLDENEFHCSVINTREILDRILHNSPIRTGFENISIDDKILIQLYPDKYGGCELYVTKITLDEMEDALIMPQENEEKYLLPRPIEKKQIKKSNLLSYRFERLEYGICAAKELILRDFSGESSFYQGNDEKYYLFIHSRQEHSHYALPYIEFLSEFGEQVNAENTYLLLLEYGKCIFKSNAIWELSKV